MKFILKGKPVAKARHRMARIGNGVRSYDTQTKEKARDKNEIERQMVANGYSKLSDCALHVDMTFGVPFPKNTSRKARNAFTYVTKKPDLDNYQKFILDVMNEIVFKDDNLVASIHAEKFYTDDPFTEVRIYPMKIMQCTTCKKAVRANDTGTCLRCQSGFGELPAPTCTYCKDGSTNLEKIDFDGTKCKVYVCKNCREKYREKK